MLDMWLKHDDFDAIEAVSLLYRSHPTQQHSTFLFKEGNPTAQRPDYMLSRFSIACFMFFVLRGLGYIGKDGLCLSV